MENILKEQIHWEEIGAYSKDKLYFRIKNGVLVKENNSLIITIELNFIVPLLDQKRIKSIILNKIDEVDNVEIKYIYEDILLKDEDLIRLYLPHLRDKLTGAYSILSQNIRSDRFKIEDNIITIESLGEFATKKLNAQTTYFFQITPLNNKEDTNGKPSTIIEYTFSGNTSCTVSNIKIKTKKIHGKNYLTWSAVA